MTNSVARALVTSPLALLREPEALPAPLVSPSRQTRDGRNSLALRLASASLLTLHPITLRRVPHPVSAPHPLVPLPLRRSPHLLHVASIPPVSALRRCPAPRALRSAPQLPAFAPLLPASASAPHPLCPCICVDPLSPCKLHRILQPLLVGGPASVLSTLHRSSQTRAEAASFFSL
ncbi:hypothetical protein BJV77DRAFT_1066349 [Russula vinacea]|nr:hypothetical protein BJV77DRAFT_1066349 [Russula vinacea]